MWDSKLLLYPLLVPVVGFLFFLVVSFLVSWFLGGFLVSKFPGFWFQSFLVSKCLYFIKDRERSRKSVLMFHERFGIS